MVSSEQEDCGSREASDAHTEVSRRYSSPARRGEGLNGKRGYADMGLGDGQRQKNQYPLALPGMERGDAPTHHGQGTEISPATHEPDNPASTKRVMEEICHPENLKSALRRVIQNRGKPGIDGMTVDQLTDHLRNHWPRIQESLLRGTYRPEAIKRVEIPKPGGGVRLLGIPTVQDRFIQQAVLQVLQPRWDGTFSDSSYGFRPGRGSHMAVRRAQGYIEQGRHYVVDIDLEKFFDRVNHDQLMALVSNRVCDKRLLILLRAFLNAGVMTNGLIGPPQDEGVPQGGPLSPLLSNLVLDQLDRELNRRGLCHVRYADDCNIYVRSERAGQRVMRSISQFITRKLKLRVNKAKSAVDHPWERKFLGFSFSRTGGRIKRRLSPETIRRLKARVRELTRAAKGQSFQRTIERLSEYLRGWNAYFRYCQTPSTFENLNSWIRRRLRCAVWRQWKNSQQRWRKLIGMGIPEDAAHRSARSLHGPWKTSRYQGLSMALSNSYFARVGLPTLAVLETA